MIILMKEKGFSSILIILLATALIVGYLIYSGKINLNKSQSPTSKTTESSPSAITFDQNQATDSAAPTSEELNGFPVYPGAKFVEKRVIPFTDTCTKDSPAFMMCGSITYSWTSNDADKVYDYYKNDPTGTGWKIGGSGGSFTDSQNYGFSAGIKNGNTVYLLNMSAENNKVGFSLAIPIK